MVAFMVAFRVENYDVPRFSQNFSQNVSRSPVYWLRASGAEAAEPRPNRVEEIRRRAAEIESLRAQPAAPVAPVAPVPVVAMENPLRQVGPAPPGAPEGVDFFKVDTSKSPISDVWARYQAQGAGGVEDLRFDRLDGPVQSNGDGDLLQEPLAVTAVAPFPQLQPLPAVPPPQLTAPSHLGFCQAPQVGSMCPSNATAWGAPGAPLLGPTPWMNLPSMMH